MERYMGGEPRALHRHRFDREVNPVTSYVASGAPLRIARQSTDAYSLRIQHDIYHRLLPCVYSSVISAPSPAVLQSFSDPIHWPWGQPNSSALSFLLLPCFEHALVLSRVGCRFLLIFISSKLPWNCRLQVCHACDSDAMRRTTPSTHNPDYATYYSMRSGSGLS